MSVPSTECRIELNQTESDRTKLSAIKNKNISTTLHIQNVEESNESSLHQERPASPSQKKATRHWCHRIFLRRHAKTSNCTLTLFRLIAVLVLFNCIMFDTAAFSSSKGVYYQEFRAVRFMVGGCYIYQELAAMIYASGAAAFGTTIDFIVLLFLSIINCILVQVNCGNSSLKNVSIFSVFRIGFFFGFVELCYRNFKELSEYKKAYRQSAHAMLRQTLLFSFTAMFLTRSGLKTVHRYAIGKYPACPYSINQCGLVELYSPQFGEGHPCEDDFIEYITSREELRIIRNLVYIHIAFHAMFNNMFLDVTSDMKSYLPRVLLISLVALLSTSVVYANVTPYRFLGEPKTFYDSIEAIFFLLLLIILGYEWCKKRSNRCRINPTRSTPEEPGSAPTEAMKKNPMILGI